VRRRPVSFEIEFLRVDKEGRETVVDREHCPLDLSFAEMKARSALDEKRKRGAAVNAVRVRDIDGHEVSVYQDAIAA
jgi:hypothetical protein